MNDLEIAAIAERIIEDLLSDGLTYDEILKIIKYTQKKLQN